MERIDEKVADVRKRGTLHPRSTHAAAMRTVMISPVKVSATVSVGLSCCGIASVADRTIKMSHATVGGIMLPRIADVLPDDAIAAPVAKYIMSTGTPRKAAWPVMYAAMKTAQVPATCLLARPMILMATESRSVSDS